MQDNKKPKVLVTGYKGFIGSNLFRRLQQEDFDVLGMEYGEDLPKEGVNIVICAGALVSWDRVVRNATEVFQNNIGHVSDCAEYCERQNAKLVFLSSTKAETNIRYVENTYALSKVLGEYLLRGSNDLQFVILRLGAIYGEGQNGNEGLGFVDHFIKSVLLQKPITIFGGGEQVRDLLHIDDLLDLLLHLIVDSELYMGRTYSIGGGKRNAISLNRLIKKIEQLTHKKASIAYTNERPEDTTCLVAKNAEVFGGTDGQYLVELGPIDNWYPKIGIEEGLKRLISYYKER